MASTIHSTSSSELIGKLITLRETSNEYAADPYEWANKPGLSVLVPQIQPETSILSHDINLLNYLTEFLEYPLFHGW
jgi:hypothetical protein